MSDSFFQKKRKRTGDGDSSSKGNSRVSRVSTAKAGPSRLRRRDKQSGESKGRKALSGANGNEDGDDDDDDLENGGIDDMDLLHRYDNDIQESDEDEGETPAEAKVRLAKLYLEGLRDDDISE
jgi:ribosomal RNA-processing protein 9